jgi:hypothetical protein
MLQPLFKTCALVGQAAAIKLQHGNQHPRRPGVKGGGRGRFARCRLTPRQRRNGRHPSTAAWATRRHCCLFALVSPPAGARQIGVPRPLVTSLNHLPAVRHTQDDWSFQASSQNSTAVADTSVLVAASPRCELTTRFLPPNKNLQRSILSLAEAVATVSNEEGSS